jgi:WD40 repeat protein
VLTLPRGHLRGSISDVALTGDGRLAATPGGADSVPLWNTGDWTRAGSLPPTVYSFNRARFSPDGRWLFVGGAQTATVWGRSATGQWTQVRDLTQATGGTWFADFSPDGTQLVTAGWESTQLWDAVRWRPLRELQGLTATVHEARFSPDGYWIVTAGGDGTVRLWHAETGELAWIVERGENVRLSADFSADGQSIVTTSASGTLRVYPCRLCGGDEPLLKLARSRRPSVIQVRPGSPPS